MGQLSRQKEGSRFLGGALHSKGGYYLLTLQRWALSQLKRGFLNKWGACSTKERLFHNMDTLLTKTQAFSTNKEGSYN
jgi:hypothetical protein